MRTENIVAFGYRKVEHAGFSWLANDEGVRFLAGVDDWSPEGLSTQKGWKCRKKRYHAVYLVQHDGRASYVIKDYPPVDNPKSALGENGNRAKKEFSNTLAAYQKSIPVVLPLAVGEWTVDRDRGVIIYPFLDKAIPLERVYNHESSSTLPNRERQRLERNVGKLLRAMVDAGAYPVDAHLDHFLALRVDGGEVPVYYIDLERIRFSSSLWFIRIKRIKTIGRLLARLEWLRVSGGGINRAGMMRISRAFFAERGFRPLDKELCRVVIKAARRYWYRREFHKRGPYRLRSFNPSE
ncbi:MAG: lipopolysaccharide kinase InaA family protein [Candidatus Binatia bacterium]